MGRKGAGMKERLWKWVRRSERGMDSWVMVDGGMVLLGTYGRV